MYSHSHAFLVVLNSIFQTNIAQDWMYSLSYAIMAWEMENMESQTAGMCKTEFNTLRMAANFNRLIHPAFKKKYIHVNVHVNVNVHVSVNVHCECSKRHCENFWINPWRPFNVIPRIGEYFTLNLTSKKLKEVVCDSRKVVKYRQLPMTRIPSHQTRGTWK